MNNMKNVNNLPSKRNESLTQEVGEIFERFARDFFSPELDEDDHGFRPNVQVEETETGYRVSAELAGMKESDIKLSLKDNSLVIEGKKEAISRSEKSSIYRTEFRYGSFSRSVPLKEDVDNNNIVANFSHGVLTVDLVKRADGPDKIHRIPINGKKH
jgi:HSP20 family protein